jgi:isopentenyl phosphate kinase
MAEVPEIVLVKLGGSLITDKTRPETVRAETLARLASEIAGAFPACRERLVVAHGSGSFGHVAAERHGLGRAGLERPVIQVQQLGSQDRQPHPADHLGNSGRPSRPTSQQAFPGQPPDSPQSDTPAHVPLLTPAQALGAAVTQDRAAALHRLVIAALLAAGAAPFSLAPSSAVVAAGGIPRELFAEPLLRALADGLLPVSYGDVVLDRERGATICSTEALFALLARALPRHGLAVRRVVWLGETDGVYDGAGRTLPRLDAASFAGARAAIGAAAGTDVTGGMLHRVEAALELAARGIPSLIANGATPGLLARALAGDAVPGTEVR